MDSGKITTSFLMISIITLCAELFCIGISLTEHGPVKQALDVEVGVPAHIQAYQISGMRQITFNLIGSEVFRCRFHGTISGTRKAEHILSCAAKDGSLIVIGGRQEGKVIQVLKGESLESEDMFRLTYSSVEDGYYRW